MRIIKGEKFIYGGIGYTVTGVWFRTPGKPSSYDLVSESGDIQKQDSEKIHKHIEAGRIKFIT